MLISREIEKPSVKVEALWVGVRYAGSGFEKRPGTLVQLVVWEEHE